MLFRNRCKVSAHIVPLFRLCITLRMIRKDNGSMEKSLSSLVSSSCWEVDHFERIQKSITKSYNSLGFALLPDDDIVLTT